MKEIKKYIELMSQSLPLEGSISYVEAEKKASEFLAAMATITDWKHSLSEEKIKNTTIQAAVYAEKLSQSTGKTITENKVTVEASKEYSRAREQLEMTENDISYLKAYYEIFSAAHIFYRQMARGESS